MKKRLFTILLTLCMVAGMIPAASAAAGVVSKSNLRQVDGTVSSNMFANNYTNMERWASTVKSYLYTERNGNLVRVEYIADKGVLVESYDPATLTRKSTKTIPTELTMFGGFFAGEKYNYLVFAQNNPNESDSVEVLRVVKYSKDWTRLSACAIKGANTYRPLMAGSMRMTETAGKLYIYTCHEMYTSSDGRHHQSNMTFVLNQESMAVVDSFYGVMNISYGYASHSFNQFIRTDGSYIYRADHGDAYPRGFSITKVGVNSNVTSVGRNYAQPLLISGSIGANDTGASLGGFELSANNCILAGNSVDQSNYNVYDCRNIFVTVTDKGMQNSKTVWLTHHSNKGTTSVCNPQLVKVNDDLFLVTWVEYSTQTGDLTAVKMATVNGEGTVLTGPVNTPTAPSDCQPIVVDGMVVWYVTENSKPYFCIVNPKDLTPKSDNDTCIFDHVWNSGTVTVAPTQDHVGEMRYNCIYCKATRTEEIAKLPPAVKTITLNQTSVTMGRNESIILKATVSPSDAVDKTVTWKSSNPNVATVTNGVVYAKELGTTTITVTSSNGKTATCVVKVQRFKDVPDDIWYTAPVEWAVSKGVTGGTSATTFSPDDSCTRGQVVTFLWSAAGRPEVTFDNPFTDVSPADYYYKAVLWAVSKGITGGTSATTFSPDDSCTRGQVVTFLYSAAGKPDVTGGKNPFVDVFQSDYFFNPVLWAVNKGITGGTSATTFSPSDVCNRAQVVTFLYKYVNG